MIFSPDNFNKSNKSKEQNETIYEKKINFNIHYQKKNDGKLYIKRTKTSEGWSSFYFISK